MFGRGRAASAGSVDEAVLAELRSIREEIRGLSDRVAQSAQRSDLEGYVTRVAFDAHVASHRAGLDSRRWWATYGVSVAVVVVSPIMSVLAVHISFILR